MRTTIAKMTKPTGLWWVLTELLKGKTFCHIWAGQGDLTGLCHARAKALAAPPA